MKVRGFYTRKGDLKFISHLNTVDLLQRAIMYTGVRVLFSEGFNVHPKMSFGNPLPLGVSSSMEVFDVELEDGSDLEFVKEKANEYLPDEINITNLFENVDNQSISKIFTHSIFFFYIKSREDISKIQIENHGELLIERKKKSKNKKYFDVIEEDISDYVEFDKFEKIDTDVYKLVAKLENSSDKIINPIRFIEGLLKKIGLNLSSGDVIIHKEKML